MRTFFIVIVCLPFLVACGEKNKGDIDLIEKGVVLTSNVADTCFCNVLVTNADGDLYQDDLLFTGVCILNYPNSDEKYIVKNILSGKLHGSVLYYDKMGNVLVEEIYQDGNRKRSGNSAPLSCDCSELEHNDIPESNSKLVLLDGIPYTGKCYEKYPNSDQASVEIGYTKGVLNGFSIFYDRQGNTMYMEKYEAGELIKVIYEN